MSLTRLTIFPPLPGQHVFLVASSIAPTIGTQQTRGGFDGFMGYVPTSSFNAVIQSGVISTTVVPVAQALAGGVPGTAYSETISEQGGIGPYTYSVSSGSLPAGLSLNASTGVISGTPTVAATSTFSITVTDSLGSPGTQSFSITIATVSSGGQNFGMTN